MILKGFSGIGMASPSGILKVFDEILRGGGWKGFDGV